MGVTALSGQAVMLICGLLTLYILRIITRYAELVQFRGPSWTGISNWPHSIAILGGNCHKWYAEVSNKHGARNLLGSSTTVTIANISIRHRSDRPCCASSADHVLCRSLDARKQQAWLQALRLVLQSHTTRVSEGQYL